MAGAIAAGEGLLGSTFGAGAAWGGRGMSLTGQVSGCAEREVLFSTGLVESGTAAAVSGMLVWLLKGICLQELVQVGPLEI